MTKTIGSIQQGVPAAELESALLAWLDNEFSQEYSMELASHLSDGLTRQKRISTTINSLILRNPLSEYLRNHEQEVRMILRDKNSRALLFAAIMCAEYSFAYDVACVMGKYFHAQEEITKELIRQKISQIYGSNRSLDIALYAVIPMMVDFGLLSISAPGVYQIIRQRNYTDAALGIYKHAFLQHNPTYADSDDILTNPFFEFIN